MNHYLNKEFPNLLLQRPLFYSWPIGIRFEIGPTNMSMWTDGDKSKVNKEYISEALRRAKAIFESAFEENDKISIVYQRFSTGKLKIHKTEYIFSQLFSSANASVKFSKQRNIYDISKKKYCFRRAVISKIKRNNFNYSNILLAKINFDFGDLNPSINEDCYFINTTKGIILNLYDDRGMDIISSDISVLKNIYTEFGNFILDYNREYIDKLFTDN